MHSMTFHTGEDETILFNGWRVTDWQGLGWSMVGVILIASLYEGMKSYRDHLFTETARLRRMKARRSRQALLFSSVHILQTLIHVLQAVISYFLMLIFMTYNVWLCVAVGIGTALGYWLFSWDKSNSENTECCS